MMAKSVDRATASTRLGGRKRMMAKSVDRATASTRLVLTCFRQKYRIKRDIEEKQLQIIEIEARMSGLYHQGLRLTPQQARSGLPMPHSTSPTDPTSKLLDLIQQKDELEKDIDFLNQSLRLTPQQARSGLPMPHSTSPTDPTSKLLDLIQQKDELEKDIDFLNQSLKQAEKIELLDERRLSCWI